LLQLISVRIESFFLNKNFSIVYSDPHKTLAQKLSTPVDEDIELKTVCSSLKLYLRTLKEPIFTFKLHNRFIEAASMKISFRVLCNYLIDF
jgi:hypothetical protein